MLRMQIVLLVLILFCTSLISKERVIILTDISNEPDDAQSLVRFLTYSNEFDIEAIIATTGCWLKNNPRTEDIFPIIDAYGQVRDNLALHADGYPTADYITSIVREGNQGYGMADVSDGNASPGSEMIIDVIDKDDPRPVWVCIWGGANTLAQALWTVKQIRTDDEVDAFISKLRVYDLAGQDNAGAWMTHTFPYLYYIRSVQQWRGISYDLREGRRLEARGGDESVVTPEWTDENIQNNHGPLGAVYPDAIIIHEGDTPTYFYLIPNGLGDPLQPSWGSWGGRFNTEPQMNVRANPAPVTTEEQFDDYWMITEDKDHWQWQDEVYDNVFCAVFRWRVDFQNDFAARMDWCVQPYENANHNPSIIVNNDSTQEVLIHRPDPGDVIELDASASSDPDGDALSYEWWVYPEPGTYPNDIEMNNAGSSRIAFEIPDDAAGHEIHLILTVRDDGAPQLTRYRRVVFRVEQFEQAVDMTPPNILSYPDSRFIDYRTEVPIQINTDERAFLRYDVSDKSFEDMQFEFQEGQGGIHHSTLVSAEQGEEKTIYARARDMAGNTTMQSIRINFSVDTLQTPISWNDLRYNVSDWKTGAAPIGFGADQIETTSQPVNTLYLRKTVELENIEDISRILLRCNFDDGMILYLNGREIRRFNLADGEVTYETLAEEENDPSRSSSASASGDDLVLYEGENLIAVEVHQGPIDNSDLSFDCSAKVGRTGLFNYGEEWLYYDGGHEPEIKTLGDILSRVENHKAPQRFSLYQNYPNPFNAETRVRFQLPARQDVTMDIFNSLGQRVFRKTKTNLAEGNHTLHWNGANAAGQPMPSGLYLVQIRTETQVGTIKSLLVR